MSAPTVTVLMPLHNSERYISCAVESILQQTYENFELLVIDDCSTDRSGEILHSYRDERIRVVHNARHIGLTRSLNKGLEMARGKYVARMDSDDIALPARIETQVRYLDEHPEVALAGTGVAICDAHGRITGRYAPRLCSESIYCTLIFHNCFYHSSVMFRLQVTKALGGYDETFEAAEDADLWYRITRTFRATMLNEILVHWRDHPLSLSKVRRNEQDLARR